MVSTKGLMARAAKLLTEIKQDTNWKIYSSMFDIEDLANSTNRLYRSQSFGDQDYPTCVANFFNAIVKKDENLAKQFVAYILSQELNLTDGSIVSKDPGLFHELGIIPVKGNVGPIPIPMPVGHVKYLDVSVLPDDFYIALVEQINKAFSFGLYICVPILTRKLLENFLVDILRKKFGMKRVDIFYDTKRGKFYGFETLLINAQTNIADFKVIAPAFNEQLLKDISKFRAKGNSTAHTIEVEVEKEELLKMAKDLEHIVKVLVRTLNSIS